MRRFSLSELTLASCRSDRNSHHDFKTARLGQAPVLPYSNSDDLEADPTCSAEPWTCLAGADGEVAPIGCSDNNITQLWLDEALAAAGTSLTLGTDETGGVNYWSAPSPTELVSLPNPCGAGEVAAGLILYETPSSIDNKMNYVRDHGMLGVEFWTMSQTINASGAYPLLEAARP